MAKPLADSLVDRQAKNDGSVQCLFDCLRLERSSLKCPIDQGPYVRHHYECWGVLFSSTWHFGQIEEAPKINPELTVLHHTKGMILTELALSTTSREIARRRLVQSEDEISPLLKNL